MSQVPPLKQFSGQRGYRLAWLAFLGGACGAPVVLAAAGMTVAFGALAPFGALLAALTAAHWLYRQRQQTLSVITGAMALMIGSALMAGIIAHAGMRLRFPLSDAELATADLMLGIDTPALVLAFADRAWLGQLMRVAYASIFPLCFASAVALGTIGRSDRAWELCWGFGAGVVIAALVSVFVPALGNVAHAGLGVLAGDRLPAGSGVYHLHVVSRYRDGIDPLLDLRQLEGVVTFPSFHMIMALAVGYAWRGVSWFAMPVAAWCALVTVSTVPIGGHYVVDLVGGAALWAACIGAVRVQRFGLAPRSASALAPIRQGAS